MNTEDIRQALEGFGSRVMELEVQLELRTETIRELNEVVIRQDKELKILQRELEALRSRQDAADKDGSRPASEEPPPPHY